MRESDLLAHIERLASPMRAAFPRVLLGPGDDCAVVATSLGDRLLLTVDQLVEGRHFTPDTPVDLVARKAVARSISDLAAMACRPLCALATGLLPPGYAHGQDLTDRLHHWGAHWGCPVVGGDLAVGSPGCQLVLTVTAIGELDTGERPVTRAGAKPGDGVYVTGRLGGSFPSERHLTFTPRIREAAWLRETLGGDLHAMIDLSDGLGRDAARIARASGVGIRLDAARLPRHPDIAEWRGALADGEDYELCFTSPRDLDGASTPDGTPITRVGIVEPASHAPFPCVVVTPDGGVSDASDMGWDHAG